MAIRDVAAPSGPSGHIRVHLYIFIDKQYLVFVGLTRQRVDQFTTYLGNVLLRTWKLHVILIPVIAFIKNRWKTFGNAFHSDRGL